MTDNQASTADASRTITTADAIRTVTITNTKAITAKDASPTASTAVGLANQTCASPPYIRTSHFLTIARAAVKSPLLPFCRVLLCRHLWP
ncbi:hypothetical protein BD410DRAFT_793084 [Rickenella mellea]|uniref:Uncharacterized protein n=1 Tax=Rickenella mellea TaxID=50990 RepID=A0A4Y7PUC5_9AGAM|nr:hypothetical protein BD410DRAFT_793084 [Rickenella mellea]